MKRVGQALLFVLALGAVSVGCEKRMGQLADEIVDFASEVLDVMDEGEQ